MRERFAALLYRESCGTKWVSFFVLFLKIVSAASRPAYAAIVDLNFYAP